MVSVTAATATAAKASAQNSAAGAAASANAKPAASGADGAVMVDLSDRAKAVIAKAKADQAAADALNDTPDEILAKRTDALSDKLSGIFDKMNIPPEFATHLQVDKFGHVTSEGPWKAKIEKMFSDDPDLAKELKTVSGLQSLKAAQTALDMYNEEKKSVTNKKQQDEAWTRYNLRSINIQALSGVMTMKDGRLRSAAVDYMDMLADPKGTASGTTAKDTKDRLV
jgi:hypothetical protein